MIIIMDAVGEVDLDRVRLGLRRAMEAHPITMARQIISFWRAWPYWKYDGIPLEPTFNHRDLSGAADWERAADQMVQDHVASATDLSQPPLVSVWHAKGPGSRHRFTFCWQHPMMDVEGAQYFISEINRLAGDTPAPPPSVLLDDKDQIDPLAEYGVWGRLKLVRESTNAVPPRASVEGLSIVDSLPNRPTEPLVPRFTRLFWPPDQVRKIQENARKIATPGPALYGRYAAACVLRAIYRIHAEHGRSLPFYGMTFPMRVGGIRKRPLAGNYLVSANLNVPAEVITDKRAVMGEVDRQVREFTERRVDLSGWAVLWLTSQLRTWQYRKLVDWVTRTQPYTTGYSFFGEIDPPLRQFVGTELTDFWAFGVVSIPPAWNPVFSRFKDRWSLVVCWPNSAFPEDVPVRYAKLIEEELFAD